MKLILILNFYCFIDFIQHKKKKNYNFTKILIKAVETKNLFVQTQSVELLIIQ